MDRVGILAQSVEDSLCVLLDISFHVCVSNYVCRVVAHHAGAVTWCCPFRIESTLFIGIVEAFLHLCAHLWVYKVDEWHQSAESVPETCVGKHIARQHLAGMWAVVYDITFCIFLVEHAREEGTSVQTAVECSQLIDVVGLDFYSAQYFVPAVTTLLLQLIKALCAQFLEVQLSLLGTDEGRCYAGMYLLAFPCGKTDDGTCVVARGLKFVSAYVTVGNGGSVGERFVEDDDKVVLEVARHTAAVLRGIAYYLALGWYDSH